MQRSKTGVLNLGCMHSQVGAWGIFWRTTHRGSNFQETWRNWNWIPQDDRQQYLYSAEADSTVVTENKRVSSVVHVQ